MCVDALLLAALQTGPGREGPGDGPSGRWAGPGAPGAALDMGFTRCHCAVPWASGPPPAPPPRCSVGVTASCKPHIRALVFAFNPFLPWASLVTCPCLSFLNANGQLIPPCSCPNLRRIWHENEGELCTEPCVACRWSPINPSCHYNKTLASTAGA